jgi:hypothetical protein
MSQTKRHSVAHTRPRPDPIFALIAASKKAEDALTRAIDALNKLETQLNKREPGHARTHNKLTTRWPSLWIGNTWEIRSDHQIDNFVHSHFMTDLLFLPPKTRAKAKSLKGMARRELRTMLHALEAKHRRAQQRAGLIDAWDAVPTGRKAAREAMDAVLSTRPTSVAGMQAFVAHLRHYQDPHADMDKILGAIEANVKMLKTRGTA